MNRLDTEAMYLKGVGPRNATTMSKVGLKTVRDVLWHFPRRYEDRRNIPPLRSLRPGQWVTVKGRLIDFNSRPIRGGRVILKAVISDKTSSVALTWFNQPWIAKALKGFEGEILAYGIVKEGNRGYEINSPEFELIGDEDDPEEFARIVPVYPLTEGLSQKTMRRAARAAVEGYAEGVHDPLPDDFKRKHRLQSLDWSLKEIHLPSSDESRNEARKRLVFDEFFYMQVALAMRRAETHQELGISFPIQALLNSPSPTAPAEGEGDRGERFRASETNPSGRSQFPEPLPPAPLSSAPDVAQERGNLELPAHLLEANQKRQQLRATNLFVEESLLDQTLNEPLLEQVHRMLPFQLTGAQNRVIHEIWDDMERPHPMNRLVQGDVGSGKTAVAACAMLAAVRSGYQTAIMAPTEILAEQHAVNLAKLFEPLGIEVQLMVGKQTASQRKKALERVADGIARVAVGTHALIQEGVQFQNLGLIVIDEQHRFGVLQRAQLRDKAVGNPDVLVMTATPIPRSLTMTIFGDLDLSVIDELPPGRKPVKTHWKQPSQRHAVYENVLKLLEEGRQAYFVCPMVSESEKMLAQAAEELYLQLDSGVFHHKKLGLLHGQMKPKEKEDVMLAFRTHALDILVSTTVIEVGVDVANASVMVIEDANRFGLSQLHQLRGRVGRGEYQSYCILIADARSEDASKRMEIMTATSDGFKIAEEDLKLRGPGEIAGTKQHGNLDFSLADLVQDSKMLETARQAAMELISEDPRLEHKKNQGILDQVREKRGQTAMITVS